MARDAAFHSDAKARKALVRVASLTQLPVNQSFTEPGGQGPNKSAAANALPSRALEAMRLDMARKARPVGPSTSTHRPLAGLTSLPAPHSLPVWPNRRRMTRRRSEAFFNPSLGRFSFPECPSAVHPAQCNPGHALHRFFLIMTDALKIHLLLNSRFFPRHRRFNSTKTFRHFGK